MKLAGDHVIGLPKRRGFLQHIYAILVALRTPRKKTHIIYEAGIGSRDLYNYFSLLLEKGLVEAVTYVTPRYRKRDRRTSHVYIITEAGETLLRLYEQIYDILGLKRPRR